MKTRKDQPVTNPVTGRNRMSGRRVYEESLFIKDNDIVRRIKVDDILFVEEKDDHVRLHTGERFYSLQGALQTIEGKLPYSKFMKVHACYLVAWNKIESLEDGMLIVGGKPLPLSRSYREVLLKQMNVL